MPLLSKPHNKNWIVTMINLTNQIIKTNNAYENWKKLSLWETVSEISVNPVVTKDEKSFIYLLEFYSQFCAEKKYSKKIIKQSVASKWLKENQFWYCNRKIARLKTRCKFLALHNWMNAKNKIG